MATAAPMLVGALNSPRLGARSQAVETKSPAFEVASIKPNKSGDGRVNIGMQPGGRYTATNVTLGMLLGQAYRLQGGPGGAPGNSNPQILNPPNWINSDHFDIVAKADGNAPPGQFPELVKSLLIERFKLAAHTESRELQVYALVLARSDGKLGPSLRPASPECAAMIAARGRRGGPPPGGPGGPGGPGRGAIAGPPQPGEPMPCGMMRFAPGNLAAGGTPISQLATSLVPWVNRIVVDKTGLTGPYEIDLKWTPDQIPGGGPGPGGDPPPGIPPIDPNGPSIFTAVQEQLGLKLDSTRAPVEVLVIDHVEPPTPD
ncbi:MAG: TIGR03435 family protein [Acidobacteriota bacterium]